MGLGGQQQLLVLLLLPCLALFLLLAAPGARAAKQQCGAAAAAEPKYNYTDVFSPERDQGIAFSSELVTPSSALPPPLAARPTRAPPSSKPKQLNPRPPRIHAQLLRPRPRPHHARVARVAPRAEMVRLLTRAAHAPPSAAPPSSRPGTASALTRTPPAPTPPKKPNKTQEQLGDVPPHHARAQRALHDVSGAHARGLGGVAQAPHHGAVSNGGHRRRRRGLVVFAFASLILSPSPKKPTRTTPPPSFFFVTDGEITITIPPDDDAAEEEEDVEQGGGGGRGIKAAAGSANRQAPQVVTVGADEWAYFPPGWDGDITSSKGASLVAFERIFAKADADPVFLHGRTDDSPLLPTAPEVFRLRKLLPQTGDYDFNVHVMDFSPGEFLEVKEVHYNQHGMIILQVCLLFFVERGGFFLGFLGLLLASFSLTRRRPRSLPTSKTTTTGPGHLPPGRPLDPRAGGRRHLDGPLRAAVVRRPGQAEHALPALQGRWRRPARVAVKRRGEGRDRAALAASGPTCARPHVPLA